MVVYKSGDILKATENIICHQVNVDGVMGGGLAKQIASTYPKVLIHYKRLCKSFDYDYEKLRGMYQFIRVSDTQQICNCFTQRPNFNTDYVAIEKCFKDILHIAKKSNLSIAIPFHYGCGIANGEWEEVITILRNLSGLYDVDISVYRLEE